MLYEVITELECFGHDTVEFCDELRRIVKLHAGVELGLIEQDVGRVVDEVDVSGVFELLA